MPTTAEATTASSTQTSRGCDTTSADNDSLAIGFIEQDRRRREWGSVVETLLEWSRDSRIVEDDGIEPPTIQAIQRARKLAADMRARYVRAPTRIVPNGDGGLSFERVNGGYLEVIEVDENAIADYLVFEGTKIVERFTLQ